MVRSVIQYRFYAHNRICSHRTFENGFSKSLFNSREIVLRNSSAHNNLLKFIWFFNIPERLESHLNMAVLTVSSRLFLVLGFNIGILPDSLTICNLGLLKFYLNLINIGQLACNDLNCLITDGINEALSVLGIVYVLNGKILFHNL